MRGSLRVARVSNIDIGLHWSTIVIVALFTFSLAGTILPATAGGYAGSAYVLAALATAGLFLVSIVAHELGHSIVAQRNGIEVRAITLFALGGVAHLDDDPPNAGAAARIALAGPAVSVVIGVGSLVAAGLLATLGSPVLLVAAIGWLGAVNLVLAVFNMLPALPLDGGRVLQAALWKRSGNRHQATISAAGVGRFLGWGLVLFGLWTLLQGGERAVDHAHRLVRGQHRRRRVAPGSGPPPPGPLGPVVAAPQRPGRPSPSDGRRRDRCRRDRRRRTRPHGPAGGDGCRSEPESLTRRAAEPPGQRDLAGLGRST